MTAVLATSLVALAPVATAAAGPGEDIYNCNQVGESVEVESMGGGLSKITTTTAFSCTVTNWETGFAFAKVFTTSAVEWCYE